MMEARVLSMWEEMKKGDSNKMNKSISEAPASTRNKIPETRSNNWVNYLGLGTEQETRQKMSSAIENGTSTVSKRVFAIWEQMNEGLPNKRLKCFSNKPTSPAIGAMTSEKLSDNWKMYLGVESKQAGSWTLDQLEKQPSATENEANDEAKKLAAAALAAVRNAAAAVASSSRGKIEISEVRDFAGQEIEIKRRVDADSKEASEMANSSAPSAVDAVLEQIKKKQKLSVLDKTKKDWGEFKEENKGLEEELDAYKKSSNQYLDRVSFLERADYRQFERERDARLAQQAKRRPDMREDT